MKHRASGGWFELSSDPTHRSRYYDSTAQHSKTNQQNLHGHTLSDSFISMTESFTTDNEISSTKSEEIRVVAGGDEQMLDYKTRPLFTPSVIANEPKEVLTNQVLNALIQAPLLCERLSRKAGVDDLIA